MKYCAKWDVTHYQASFRMPSVTSITWAHSIGMELAYATCTPCEFAWDHIHTCNTCGTAFKTSRHERVVSALNAAARRFGVVSSTNFFSNFGTGHNDDHPDVVFYRTSADKPPLVVDVTVRHQPQRDTPEAHPRNHVRHGASEKIAKYRNWFAGDVEFHPLAFSTHAHMPTKTYEVLREVGRYALPGFVPHAVRRIKCAIVSEASLRRKVLLARFGSLTQSAAHAVATSVTGRTTSSTLPDPQTRMDPPAFNPLPL
jgi:hypothetical protein